MLIPAGVEAQRTAPAEKTRTEVIRLKKIAVVVLALLICLSIVTGLMAAPRNTPVKVKINGCDRALKPAAFSRGGTVYLPLSATAAAVGASVKQDRAAKGYVVTSGPKKSTVKESQGIKVNGQLMVPLSVMSKALDCSAKWDASTRTVQLNAKPAPQPKPDAKPQPKPSTGGT